MAIGMHSDYLSNSS